MIKDKGVKLVRKEAVELVKKHLEQEVEELVKQAEIFKLHAGRKILREEDIKLAIMSRK
jgi:histone H3/H4